MSRSYSITYNLYESGHVGSSTYQTARLVATFTVPDSTDITSGTGSTPTISYSINLQLKKQVTETYLNSGTHDYAFYSSIKIYGDSTLLATKSLNTSFSSKNATLSTSWVTVKTVTGSLTASTFNTSAIFNSGNTSTKTSNLGISFAYTTIRVDDGTESHYGNGEGAKVASGAVFTLNVPATATVSSVSYDTGWVYAGLTTASVTISDLAAYYNGSVTNVVFAIGSQQASRTNNGTLSILLNDVGTFTPTVTVTDSRNQENVYSLTPVTVNTYTAPSVSFAAERTLSSGKPDDEGDYATLSCDLTFSDAIATAIAPSVVMTDDSGTQTTPTVTWYTTRAADGTLSGSVTWANVSSGDTVYGLVPNVNTQHSYQISVRPRDDKGTGTAIVQTLSTAYYTIDFQAGGKEIAFGAAANDNLTNYPNGLFKCGMDAVFNGDVTANGDTKLVTGDTEIENPYFSLDTTASPGTTDGDLYAAIVALGWDSDVIV